MKKSGKIGAVKLSDIAVRTGVSQSTVSRVLNNQPGISEATRDTVLFTLRELGYKAEAFDTLNPESDGRMRIDVVICPLSEQKNPMGMGYYTTIIDGIRSRIDAGVVNLRLNIATESSSELQFRRDAAGVLLVGNPSSKLMRQLHEFGIPFVILSNNPPDSGEDLVTTDKFTESLRVCNFLYKRGIRRIGLIVPGIDVIYSEGFRCGAARHGVVLREEDIQLVPDTELGSYIAPVHAMLKKGSLPEALVFASYDAANLCEEMLKLKGVRVPEDILLVAFTDFERAGYERYISIHFDTSEMSRLAMERLLHKIAEPDRPGYRIVVPMRIQDIQSGEREIQPEKECGE
ncbi:MAG: LacI family DNA-binding transcriptional regulator [Lentisphaeria bacterium]|nr:LacI family DNA-binding transcriptional regulator [Lentisphaeria bacterium]